MRCLGSKVYKVFYGKSFRVTETNSAFACAYCINNYIEAQNIIYEATEGHSLPHSVDKDHSWLAGGM